MSLMTAQCRAPEVARAPDPEVAVKPPPSQEVKQETPQNAVPTWNTQIVAQLERYKATPGGAIAW